jgi:hypothetical protein
MAAFRSTGPSLARFWRKTPNVVHLRGRSRIVSTRSSRPGRGSPGRLFLLINVRVRTGGNPYPRPSPGCCVRPRRASAALFHATIARLSPRPFLDRLHNRGVRRKQIVCSWHELPLFPHAATAGEWKSLGPFHDSGSRRVRRTDCGRSSTLTTKSKDLGQPAPLKFRTADVSLGRRRATQAHLRT